MLLKYIHKKHQLPRFRSTSKVILNLKEIKQILKLGKIRLICMIANAKLLTIGKTLFAFPVNFFLYLKIMNSFHALVNERKNFQIKTIKITPRNTNLN